MKIQRGLVLLFLFLVVACGSTPTQIANENHADLRYPKETKNLVLNNLYVYDEPLYGAALTYVDPAYPSDTITVYVYPIRATEWTNSEDILLNEMDSVYAEIKNTYQKVSEETRRIIRFEDEKNIYSGLKSRFDFYHEGRKINSFAYLFLSKDKYIKFRTSFDASYTPDWNGDQIVQEVLPGIEVPNESPYMKKLREKLKKRDGRRSSNSLKIKQERKTALVISMD